MKQWTIFQPLAVFVLTVFFLVYGFDIALYADMATAHAESIDDLLDDDDDDLLDSSSDDSPADDAEPEDDFADDEPEKEKASKDDDFEDDEKDDKDSKDEAKNEDKDDFEDDDEDEVVAKPAKKSSSKKGRTLETLPIGPNKKGAISVLSYVFPAESKSKSRTVETRLIVQNYLRTSNDFTYVSVNKALKDSSGGNEKKILKTAVSSLEKGMKQFKAKKYGDAVDELEESVTAFGPILEYPEHRQKAEEALLYLGAAFVLDGEKEEGQNVFTRLLKINPDTSVKGKELPEKALTFLDDVKEDLSSSDLAAVKVESTPNGLPVFMDGQYRGLSPLSLDKLSVGEHYMKVLEPAYMEHKSKMSLYEGMTKKINVNLKQTARYYQFKSEADVIQGEFQHEKMWDAVMNLADETSTDYLLFTQVEESRGVVTLEAHYYNLPEERFKQASYEIELSDENLISGVYGFLDNLFSDDVDWQDTYFEPVEEDKVAAAGAIWWKSWWFWTIVGVAVAGGVTTGVVLGLQGSDDSSSGNQNFDNPNAILVKF